MARTRQRDGQATKRNRQSNLYFRPFLFYKAGVQPPDPFVVRRRMRPAPASPVAISILAGGLSTRMGRDKAALRFRGKTLLGHVRAAAKATGWPVRVIRRDLVERCGPLGGIYTALKTSEAAVEVFLACDMPFVSTELLRQLVAQLSAKRAAVFAVSGLDAGFPLVIRVDALPVIESQMAKRAFSLQKLASALKARRMRIPMARQAELRNINTPEEWQALALNRAVNGRISR
jgi:molybdopterin-guanine dinucleotide biosynthesis protein A